MESAMIWRDSFRMFQQDDFLIETQQSGKASITLNTTLDFELVQRYTYFLVAQVSMFPSSEWDHNVTFETTQVRRINKHECDFSKLGPVILKL